MRSFTGDKAMGVYTVGKLSVSEALEQQIAEWSKLIGQPNGRLRSEVARTCTVIAGHLTGRLHSGLMVHKFSTTWLNPILKDIEVAAKNMYKASLPAEGHFGEQAAQVAAGRFESLEFEADRQANSRRFNKLEQRLAKLEGRK